MEARFCTRSTAVLVLCFAAGGSAQSAAQRPVVLAQLELATEVATTTDDGYPAALRVTVKNVGNVTVSMPVLGDNCAPDNGVKIQSSWSAADGAGGVGGGASCGIFDGPRLWQRAKGQWIRLRPGEFMTSTLRLQLPKEEPGEVDYWVVYTPPNATVREMEDMLRAGYVIPTEKIETEHQRFVIH